MGYGEAKIAVLQKTVNNTLADFVVVATLIDLIRVVGI